MIGVHKAWWVGGFLFGLMCLTAKAQDVQFEPELDQNLKLNSVFRLGSTAKGDREGGDPVQTQIGPDIEFYIKPLLRLKRITAFDLNDAKSKSLVLETGYLSVTAPDTPNINRMILSVTSHAPLKYGFLVSDRNRADLDWETGKTFEWRYRNLLQVERAIPIYSYHMIPYVSAEPYYETKYEKWSTTALTVGGLFPVGQHVQFDLYYEHDNNTGGKKNAQTENIGLALHLYFSLEKPKP